VDGSDSKSPRMRVVDRRWWARESVPEGTEPIEATGVRKPSYVEELEERVAQLGAELRQLTEERRRSVDEFDQARQRLRREQSRDVERARRAVITSLLDVLDNLDRAVTAGRDVLDRSGDELATGEKTAARLQAATNMARGVELVREQFRSALQALGVTRLPALDQPFDAERHEAVTTAPVTDASREGHVVAVIKEGYTIGDEILRPASVVVGRMTES
jgi:molecular chaperone GrpE